MHSKERFDQSSGGTPLWEIGEAQPVLVALAQSGDIIGRVLDVGCGTGENALYLAGMGLEVWGIDSARGSIEQARTKSLQLGFRVHFRLLDALDLPHLRMKFDAVIDSDLFHVFTGKERAEYEKSLAEVVVPGGRYFMLCFSEQETRENPGPVMRGEIREAFRTRWAVDGIREVKFKTLSHEGGAWAWLASLTRLRD